MTGLGEIYDELVGDPSNASLTESGLRPVYAASALSRIVIIGQAPGKRAQESGTPWDDASGVTLRRWLGVTDEEFYDADLFALIPMDFYYPGRGASGDLPPRPEFAPRWHPRILSELPDLRLTILIGGYAQKYYLGATAKTNLTRTVEAYRDYLPAMIPLVHPSPLNFRWQAKNPWFERDVVPALRQLVADAIA
ncbi:MAG: Uracil-DNA glycosylase superfamily [Glaciihabitans sp.]|nr:Uracil-DNA glycosylase superfamily [Glaciihabitans sp.]